ncbi:MAG: hypothetical protein JWQ98_2221 [Chlorobi bacterium]|nr:hypothetical protein [Chlorobiota bacterium]
MGSSDRDFRHDFSQVPVRQPVSHSVGGSLKLSSAGAMDEQEAESIAREIAGRPDHGTIGVLPLMTTRRTLPAILRQPTAGETSFTQDLASESEESADATAAVRDVLGSSGQPLGRQSRVDMETGFGHDFSHVRIHTDAKAAKAASALHANAFTVGSHIVFGENRFAPRMSAGRALLAHELTHVLQQGTHGVGTTGIIQRDAEAEKREEDVKRVPSSTVKSREESVKITGARLEDRLKARREDIQKSLDQLGSNPKSEKKASALKADLAKDLDAIVREPDSRYTYKGHRKDIIDSVRTLGNQTQSLAKASKRWKEFDAIFAGNDVAEALGKQSITAAELKSLIAQESSDQFVNDLDDDIAGIAQLGTEEEKNVGGESGDRKIPEKAIVLLARIISRYASNLDTKLDIKPTGIDRKKFIVASYNAGVGTIVTAQREAIKRKLDGTTWQSLITGGRKSALRTAIAASIKKVDPDDKYSKMVYYINAIFTRVE